MAGRHRKPSPWRLLLARCQARWDARTAGQPALSTVNTATEGNS